MKKKIILSLLLICLLFSAAFLSSCLTGKNTSGNNIKIASYIRTWELPLAARTAAGSAYWRADTIAGAPYLSDLIISFALIDERDGTSLYIPGVTINPAPFANLWEEAAALKEIYPHLRFNFSIGGWEAEGFSDMANDLQKREIFVNNVIDWLERYNLDGVDIDWEYPAIPSSGQSIKSRPEDAQNYVHLLRDLRNAMDLLGEKTGKYFRLSTAVPAARWFIAAIDVKAVAEFADALKVMSYDFYGSWSSTTGHQANLYNHPADHGGFSTDQAVRAYIAAGVPPQKIMIGAAFYGRAWRGVSPGRSNGLYQPFTGIPFGDGSLSWTEIERFLEPDSGFTRYWDPIAGAPFLYNGDIWISYSDEQQMRLLNQYARKHNLGGIFSWEYAQDMSARLLRALAAR